MEKDKNICSGSYSKKQRTVEAHPIVTAQLNINLKQHKLVWLGFCTTPPHPPLNILPTSTQPRVIKFGIQAQPNLLIKLGQ